jgi:hypothetical protein
MARVDFVPARARPRTAHGPGYGLPPPCYACHTYRQLGDWRPSGSLLTLDNARGNPERIHPSFSACSGQVTQRVRMVMPPWGRPPAKAAVRHTSGAASARHPSRASAVWPARLGTRSHPLERLARGWPHPGSRRASPSGRPPGPRRAPLPASTRRKQSPRIPQRTKRAETSDCWSGRPVFGAAGMPCPRDS